MLVVLEIVALEMTTKTIRADTYMKRRRERVSDFRSCNAEAACAE